MREIKFRGRTTDSTWRYGGYHKNDNGDTYIIVGSYPDKSIGWAFVQVDPKTIGQFTGDFDNDGNEIYENDILYFSYGIPGRRVDAPIVYENGSFYAITKRNNPDKCLLGELKYHVMDYWVEGNIYENPELLENL